MNVLNAKAWLGAVALAVAMGLALFVPAGTVRYWQGWVFLAVFFGASSLGMVYLMNHDPALLRRRLRGGPLAETERSQQIIMVFASLGFVGLLVVPGVDHRFGWSNVPPHLVALGNILIAVGFYGVYRVFRENTFTAPTIEVAADQRVVSTGPYAVVRHPMYIASLLYLVGMPLALGSYWGLVVFVLMLLIILWRLLDEERVLAGRLPGYTAYMRRVRWRLVPGVF
jgi:protein-S-isoprenylcysteine O-methyltransferase Ste14